MKKLFSFIFICFAANAHGQITPISTWISDDLSGLCFYKDELQFDFNGSVLPKRYYMVKDTLMMTDGFVPSSNDTAKENPDLAKFLMIQKGDKSLIMTPVNVAAKRMTKGLTCYFKNIKYIKDAAIKFTRIHLNAGMCYGTCPELSIDINNNGTYYLKGGQYAGRYQGYFKGRLNTMQLDTLNYLIQHSQVEKMQGWKQKVDVSDLPPYNLTLYYNNKKLIIQTNWPPIVIQNLLKFLTSSYEKVTLLQDKEKHEFNEDDGMKYH